jgi:protein ImuB
MRRVISLYLPHWPSDRLRRMRREVAARDKPLVTAMVQGQRRILASVDEAAVRVGLSVGMTATHAQSRIPDLTASEATPEEDEAALFRLALWMHQIFAVGDAKSAGWRVHRCRGVGASLSRRGRPAARPLP